jgi:hypothetical protein
MAAIVTLIVISLVSLIAVRAGATALMMTGLSWDAASFQSYSAFFGVGFTTREAELVVNHPVRRRIIRDLILAGNIGITSSVATLVATLVQNSNGFQPLLIVFVVCVALALLVGFSRVSWVQLAMDRVIQRTLKQAGIVRVMDYELLLRVQHGYVILEVDVLEDNKLAKTPLRQSRPWDHGVIVLAVARDGEKQSGIPNAETIVRPGDVLTVYGRESAIHKLFDTIPVYEGPRK